MTIPTRCRSTTELVNIFPTHTPMPLDTNVSSDIRPTFRMKVTRVEVSALVVDAEGKPVRDLKANEFEVYDGGRKLSALREASHVAESAARAGAQAVDQDLLRTTGEIEIDVDRAVDLAAAYLAQVGRIGPVDVDGDSVTVTVDITFDPILLPVGEIRVSATETATAVTEEPET